MPQKDTSQDQSGLVLAMLNPEVAPLQGYHSDSATLSGLQADVDAFHKAIGAALDQFSVEISIGLHGHHDGTASVSFVSVELSGECTPEEMFSDDDPVCVAAKDLKRALSAWLLAEDSGSDFLWQQQMLMEDHLGRKCRDWVVRAWVGELEICFSAPQDGPLESWGTWELPQAVYFKGLSDSAHGEFEAKARLLELGKNAPSIVLGRPRRAEGRTIEEAAASLIFPKS